MTVVYLDPAQAWTFARLPLVLKSLDITERKVLHIGAHLGEEVGIYQHCGFTKITLVEPDPRQVHYLLDKFGAVDEITVHGVAIGTEFGDADLYLAERTVWSGLSPHPTASTGKTYRVPVVPLSSLQDDHNIVVIDTQGTELDILKTADLSTLDLVIIETTPRHNDTASRYADVESYMTGVGWRLVEIWVHDKSGYDDAVFAPCA